MLALKNPRDDAGDIRDMGLIPGSGRSPKGGHGNPFQYSCLENPMDMAAWWATVQRVTKSQTQLKHNTHVTALMLPDVHPLFSRKVILGL